MAEPSAPQAILYRQQEMEVPELQPFAGGEAAVFSASSPNKETPNEDSAALIPYDSRTGILVVADGLGGLAAGEEASRLALETLKKELAQAALEGQMIRTAVINGFERANRRAQELGVGAATTLAVVEVGEKYIRPYHVGDSTILQVGGRGKVKLRTVSHSPVGYAVEAGMLDEKEALHHEDRHLVSNVVGTPDMRIEVGSRRELAMRDTLLLASDGLLDNLHEEEIVQRIRKGRLAEVAADLAESAGKRMLTVREGHPSKPDDLTFVLFRRR